jgi:hypothetical protein
LISQAICRKLTAEEVHRMRNASLQTKLLRRIAQSKGDVFLRSDFADLGGYDQIGRGLAGLTKRGVILRIGQGLYARAAPSPFDNTPVPVKGVSELMTEALGRCGIQTRPTRMQRDYNAGRIKQVPTGRVIGVDRRVRRKLGYNGWDVQFERA